MKDEFQKQIEKQYKNFFKNYWEMEKTVISQLKNKGHVYFLDNRHMIEYLRMFEPTLKDFCEICEKIGHNQGWLLNEYLHINDMKNVKVQLKFWKPYPQYSIYKDWGKYQDSGNVLESKYLSIKYDRRVERFAQWVFEKAKDIDKFIEQEWKGIHPPKIRVFFMAHKGAAPYDRFLNATYLPVKSEKKVDVLLRTSTIIHETFHLINSHLITQKAKFKYDWNMNSFKLLDEGYAQLIQFKFTNNTYDERKRVDYYSLKILKDDDFNISDLQDKWAELFNEKQEIAIYELALSFSFFLENKFGHEKLKNVFLPKKKIKENSWLEYVVNYFGNKISDLLDEWKHTLSNNIDLKPEIESVPIREICTSCNLYKNKKKETVCFMRRFYQRNKKKFRCDSYIELKEE